MAKCNHKTPRSAQLRVSLACALAGSMNLLDGFNFYGLAGIIGFMRDLVRSFWDGGTTIAPRCAAGYYGVPPALHRLGQVGVLGGLDELG